MSYILGKFYQRVKKELQNASIESPDLEARIILKHRAGLTWADLIARPDHVIGDDIVSLIQEDIRRRIQGEPLSRIHGVREFYGLDFKVTKDTLDPRPETEVLIDAALKRFPAKPPGRILDLGTGTGCILITLLKHWPEAQGVAVDMSEAALNIARANADHHNLRSRMMFLRSDWFESLKPDSFDLVVSNPPYISNCEIESLHPEVKNHDPILALHGGEDGLAAYKIIFSALDSFLTLDGTGLFEIGYSQGMSVSRLAEDSGFCVIELHRDFGGHNRVLEIARGDK